LLIDVLVGVDDIPLVLEYKIRDGGGDAFLVRAGDQYNGMVHGFPRSMMYLKILFCHDFNNSKGILRMNEGKILLLARQFTPS